LHNYNDCISSEPHLQRTEKHVAAPSKNSTCKRLCMYLRCKVRHADKGVDFGLWKKIKPHQLILPLDVHVMRSAQDLGLIKSEKSNWTIAVELTKNVATLNPSDPVVFDFALFGTQVFEKN